MKSAGRKGAPAGNMEFDTKEEPEVILLDEEDCPFTIITVKIGENGAIEETNEPVINLDPEIHSSNDAQNRTIEEANEPVISFSPEVRPADSEPVDDSSETDNSDDWTDDMESPANVSIQPKAKRKRRKKGPHVCPHCGKTFSQGLHLKDHIMTHTGEKPFKCLLCDLRFVQRSNLNRHINQHHPSEAPLLMAHKMTQSFNCWDCKKSFSTHYNYTEHMETHRNEWGDKQSSSVRSGEAFNLNPSSDSDALSDAAQITYSCAFCDQEYPDEESLASHMDCHTAVQSPNSFICEDKLVTEHLNEEERADEYSAPQNPESFSCQYCGKQFNTNMKLSYHERTHRIKRTFRCSFCRRGFNKRESYEQHMKMHSAKSAVQTERQKGEQTGEFANQQSVKAFHCKYCGKPFSTTVSLSYHERTHRIQRTFRCSVCTRGFNQRQAFDRHMRTHSASAVPPERHKEEENSTQQPPLCCKYCGKQCATEQNLSYHERTHKIKRTFRCSVCRSGFNSRQTYERHITTHFPRIAVQSEDPKLEESVDEYSPQESRKACSCKYCGKQFNTKLSLSYHERTHKIKRTFRCSVCSRGFNSRQAYDRHIRTHSAKPAVKTEQQMKEETDLQSTQQSPDSFRCKYCGKQCKTKLSLSYHERSHKVKRTFRCYICMQGFDSRQVYERHIRMHLMLEESEGYPTKQTPKPFSCVDCGARFSTELALSEHEKTHRTQMAYRCSVCSKGFNRRQTYERHIKLHTSKPAVPSEYLKEDETDEDFTEESLELFHCSYCGKRCNTKQNLSYHERTHRIKRTFRCSVCNRGFNKRQAYVKHLRRHSFQTAVETEHQEEEDDFSSHMENHPTTDHLKPFSCDVCGARFTAKHYLVRHMKYHTSDPYCCEFCDRKFTTKAACVMHMKSHIMEMPYSCSVCSEKFKFPGRLALHMRTHGINHFKPFSCSICQSSSCFHKKDALKAFSSKDCGERSSKRLLHHERGHRIKTEDQKVEENSDVHSAQKSPKSFSCKDCGVHFSRKLSLEYHMRMHKLTFPFPCSICKTQFRGRHLYEEHMRMHYREVGNSSSSGQSSDEELQNKPGEIIFSCPLCDKELPTEQELKTHMDHHEKKDPPKPFSCDKSGARFTEKQNLESHREVHNVEKIKVRTDERPYSCTVCNKRFDCREKLENHTRLHGGVKPFSCPVCLKKFSSDVNLQRHIPFHKSPLRIQTGESPFSCSVCSKAFSCRSKLEEHARVHSEDNPFRCPVCLQRFSSAKVLKRHMPLHRGEDKHTLDCEDCGKRYSSKLGLYYHKRSHLKQYRQTFQCSVCNAGFDRRLAYDWHVKMHCPQPAAETEQPEGEQSCELCGAVFTDSASLEYHKRTHEIGYAFSCSVCGRGFKIKEVYELHLKTHEEANETDLEDKTDSGDLMRHMDSVGSLLSGNS